MFAMWSSPAAPVLLLAAYLVLSALALRVHMHLAGRYSDAETTARGASAIIPMGARQFFMWSLQPVWLLVRWTRLPATGVTTLAMLLGLGAGLAIAAGKLALGGWLYLAAGVCDVLDGRIARRAGTAGPSGAAIDSVLDRICDAAVLVGMIWYFHERGWPQLIVAAALVGSLLVSYVRARGEGLGVDVKVGLMQRPERVVLLGAALALAPVVHSVTDGVVAADVVLIACISFIAVTTFATAIHRLIHVVGRLGGGRPTLAGWGRIGPAVVSAFVATAADFGLVSVLVMSFGIGAARATAAGCLLGAIINFTLNRHWTFSSSQRPAPQAMRYGIVSVSSALLNSGGVALALAFPLLDYRLAWVIVRGLVFLCWNFPLQRDYVYGRDGGPALETDRARRRHLPRTHRDEATGESA